MIPLEAVKQTGDFLGLDWNTIDIEELAQGMNVEQEHDTQNPQTDTVPGKGDLLSYAKIALAHLQELPDYYSRLDKIEKQPSHKQVFEKWQEYLFQETDVGYIQHHYQLFATITINKKLGGEISEKMREIRAIPSITTINNEGVVSEDEFHHKAVYKIKFVLMRNENVDSYLNKVLKPYFRSIKGLRLEKIEKLENITVEK